MKSFLTVAQLKKQIKHLENLIAKFPTVRSLVRKWGFELVRLEGKLEALEARKQPETPKQLVPILCKQNRSKTMKLKLMAKNDKLFAVSEDDQFIGEIINSIAGGCKPNPPYDEPGIFEAIFGGHGYIYHQDDNPPNPFFNKSWKEVFKNPDLLPEGTRNVFIDQSYSSLLDFRAVPVTV